ncbi:hypothetical protein ACTXT7_012712 [Hymenolepis weldensis]
MAEKITTLAYNNGVNYFDTSEFYSEGRAERKLGKILKSKGWRYEAIKLCSLYQTLTFLKGYVFCVRNYLKAKLFVYNTNFH